MTAATIHYCQICDWSHTEPGLDVPPEALAQVFGAGVMTAVADTQRCERIERALQTHVDGHSRLEFITALSAIARTVVRREMDMRLTFIGYSMEQRREIERAAGLPHPWRPT